MNVEKGGRRPRVLLVDDSEDTRELYREILCSAYDIVEASSGKSALSQAELGAPDVIVMDLSLPDMRGEEAIVALRRSGRTHVPIIVLSGYDQPRGNASGWDAYLVKPCPPSELSACIEKLLGTAGL